jgi:hypothetical protein
VTFTDGTSTIVDDTYLFESIRIPDKHIVESYQNVMPLGVAESLTDEQVNDLIEFIKSIE